MPARSPLAGLVAGFARLVSGARVKGEGAVPDARQRIYFANHTSHLDAVVLWAALPPATRSRTRPVAAREYWEDCGLKRYLADQAFHALLIPRARPAGEPGGVERMVEAMAEGYSLILFPEGTRGSGPHVGPFRSGLFHVSRCRPDVELVPVYLANTNRVLPKGTLVPVPLLCTITFGQPVRVEDGESSEAFLERARQTVESLGRP